MLQPLRCPSKLNGQREALSARVPLRYARSKRCHRLVRRYPIYQCQGHVEEHSIGTSNAQACVRAYTPTVLLSLYIFLSTIHTG